MIKIQKQLIILICLVLTTSFTYAADQKIGFVNTARLLKEAPQAEAARKKLEKEFAPRDKKIVKMQKKLKSMDDKLAKDASIMSESARKKMERKIVSEKRDIKRSKEEFTEDLNIRRNEELTKLQKLIYDTILTLAKEDKYDVILGESVLYSSKRIDVTEKILARLKSLYKNQTSDQK